MAAAKTLRHYLGERVAGDLIIEKIGRRAQQRGFNTLALAGTVTFTQRRQDGDHRRQSRAQVHYAHATAHRLAIVLAGDAHHAGARLHRGFVARQFFTRRARRKRAYRAVHELGIDRVQNILAQAKFFQCTGPEVFEQHVGGCEQFF